MEKKAVILERQVKKEENSGHCLIIGGGEIQCREAREILGNRQFRYIIAADKGLRFLYREGILPTHIVGDFDSLDPDILDAYAGKPGITIRILNPVKDNTDTETALLLAVELNAEDILLLGAFGGRMDHTLANIEALLIPYRAGIPCVLADACNRISLFSGKKLIRRKDAFGKYLSVMAVFGTAAGVSLSGVKYPLHNAVLTAESGGLSVSNELTEPIAEISVKEGLLLLIFSKDKEDPAADGA